MKQDNKRVLKPKPGDPKNTKLYKFFDEYKCTRTHENLPISEHGIELLAQELMEWARRKDSFLLVDFFDEYGISKGSMHAWRKRSEVLQAAFDYALDRVGANRERAALDKKIEITVFKHMQHRYDPAWREADEYHSALRAKENKSQFAGYVVVPEIPKSDLVPDRGDLKTPDREHKEDI